eukprot:gene16880-23155_t
MLLKARTMLHSRLAARTAPLTGRPSRLRWTSAPPVHFGSLDEQRARPAGAKYPLDSSECDQEPDRQERLLVTITACRNLRSLQKFISQEDYDMNMRNTCTAMDKTAILMENSTDQLDFNLAQRLIKGLSADAFISTEDMDTSSLSSVLWALIKTDNTSATGLVEKILYRTEARLNSLDSYNSLKIMWAMAYLGVDDRPGLSSKLLSAGTKDPKDLLPLKYACVPMVLRFQWVGHILLGALIRLHKEQKAVVSLRAQPSGLGGSCLEAVDAVVSSLMA